MKTLTIIFLMLGSMTTWAGETDHFKINRQIYKHRVALELLEREISLRLRCHEIAISGIEQWDKNRIAKKNRILLKLLKTRNIEHDGTMACGHSTSVQFQSTKNNHTSLHTRIRQLQETLFVAEQTVFPSGKIIPSCPSLGLQQAVTAQLEAEWKTYLDAVKQFREM